MKCNHDKYKKPPYMFLDHALRDNNICWTGLIVDKCECGESIGHAKRVQAMTANEYMRGLNK